MRIRNALLKSKDVAVWIQEAIVYQQQQLEQHLLGLQQLEQATGLL